MHIYLISSVFIAVGIYSLLKVLIITPRTLWSEPWFAGISLGALFIIYPTVMSIVAFHKQKRKNQSQKLKALYPNAPWKWKPDWSQGYCENQIKNSHIIPILGGTIIILFTLPMLPKLAQAQSTKQLSHILPSLIPLAGLASIIFGVKQLYRMRRYGNVKFVLDGECGVAGGKLKGHAIIPTQDERTDLSVSARLDCGVVSSSSNYVGRTRFFQLKWQKEVKSVLHPQTNKKARFEIECDLPYELGIVEEISSTRIKWELTLRSESKPEGLLAIFEIPVFTTQESDESLTAEKVV